MASIKVMAMDLQPGDIIFTGELVLRTWKDKLTDHGKIEILFLKPDNDTQRQVSYRIDRQIHIERTAAWQKPRRLKSRHHLHTGSMMTRHALLYGGSGNVEQEDAMVQCAVQASNTT